MRSLRVVQVVLNLGRGGMESMALSLSRGLRRRGHAVTVVALDGGGEREPELLADDVPYHVLGGRRLTPGFVIDLRGLLRRLEPDVVHSHHFAPLLYTVPAAAFGRAPRLVHTEHSYQYLLRRRDYRVALRLLCTRCNAVAVVGTEMRWFYEERIGIPRDRVHVVANGVSTEEFVPAGDRSVVRRAVGMDGGFVVGTVGRLFPVKRYSDLIRGVALAARSVPDLRLVVVGDGPERGALETLTAELGVRDRVRFAGWQLDVLPWVQSLDVFALTSESEGLPMAVLEAMAAEVPVVCTKVGDIGRIVTSGRDGILVTVGAPDELAARLVELAHSPEMLRSMGRAARRTVCDRYAQKDMVSRYEELYRG